MLRAVIVDGEINAVHSLKWEIEHFCQGIEVCETFTDPVEAVSGINYLKPDCVFLDIERPQIDGFQLLERLTFRNFDLIFTTAFDTYALRAFKESAIDYLLKPVDSDDLQKAVKRIKANKSTDSLGADLAKMLRDIEGKKISKIPLSFVDKTIFVRTENIIYCKSDGNYTHIFLKDQKNQILSKKIKEVEALINKPEFFRTHHSYLVNLSYVREFIKSDGQYLVLEDGSSVPVSRSKKAKLMEILEI
jgi:two-component system LytT family response regulator